MSKSYMRTTLEGCRYCSAENQDDSITIQGRWKTKQRNCEESWEKLWCGIRKNVWTTCSCKTTKRLEDELTPETNKNSEAMAGSSSGDTLSKHGTSWTEKNDQGHNNPQSTNDVEQMKAVAIPMEIETSLQPMVAKGGNAATGQST